MTEKGLAGAAVVEGSSPAGWYVRRNKAIKGPFPVAQIRRFVLLGRIHDSDELSLNRERWTALANLPHLRPRQAAEGSEPDTKDHRALRREDERAAGDRRHAQSAEAEEKWAQRRKGERRQPEAEEIVNHRELKTRFLNELREEQSQAQRTSWGQWIGVAVFVVVVVSLSLFIGSREMDLGPQCDAAPAPGVNWSNCRLVERDFGQADLSGSRLRNAKLSASRLFRARLQGADLAYAELSRADLSYAVLSKASLKGANLQRADLAYSDLRGADLSYADLSGASLGEARLEGAKLVNSIWVDGTLCGRGSVGGCRKP